MLRRYDTLIIDEAHERSLNIDFLLGYLKQLLPRRPDLKVIITSATIDPERFAEHFATTAPAPIIEVSGRTYPVEVRYRPLSTPRTTTTASRSTATRPRRSSTPSTSSRREGPGDILVFLSGEREIRDTADALRRLDLPRHRGPAAVRPAVGGRAAPGLRSRTPAAASCSPPTSPRRR